MQKYSIAEVIEQAVRTEKLGYEFYTSMALKFQTEPKLKALFDKLAEKELVHEKRFTELKDIIGASEPEGWEEVSEYMRAIVESEFFLGRDKALPDMTHIARVSDAVKFAISFEKETLLYFYAIKESVAEKEVVEEIINEEKSHVMWLSRFREELLK